MSEEIDLIVKWSGKEYRFEKISLSHSVGQFKDLIYKETNVKVERQKLLGIKFKGRMTWCLHILGVVFYDSFSSEQ